MSPANRRCPLTSPWVAWVLPLAIASGALRAASWESIPTISGTITIEADTLGPSAQIAGATGVWIQYAPSLSVDCSPPRGCYASRQRIHYTFSCTPRYAILTARTSFDLNGAILKHETLGMPAASNDEAANRVLTAFCGLSEHESR